MKESSNEQKQKKVTPVEKDHSIESFDLRRGGEKTTGPRARNASACGSTVIVFTDPAVRDHAGIRAARPPCSFCPSKRLAPPYVTWTHATTPEMKSFLNHPLHILVTYLW